MKIPVNGVSASRATLTVPPFLTAFLGVASLKLLVGLSTFEFELLPHAANVKATPESKVKLPNSLAFFIVIFLHLFGTS